MGGAEEKATEGKSVGSEVKSTGSSSPTEDKSVEGDKPADDKDKVSSILCVCTYSEACYIVLVKWLFMKWPLREVASS